jgi:hypothetical protein
MQQIEQGLGPDQVPDVRAGEKVWRLPKERTHHTLCLQYQYLGQEAKEVSDSLLKASDCRSSTGSEVRARLP